MITSKQQAAGPTGDGEQASGPGPRECAVGWVDLLPPPCGRTLRWEHNLQHRLRTAGGCPQLAPTLWPRGRASVGCPCHPREVLSTPHATTHSATARVAATNTAADCVRGVPVPQAHGRQGLCPGAPAWLSGPTGRVPEQQSCKECLCCKCFRVLFGCEGPGCSTSGYFLSAAHLTPVP